MALWAVGDLQGCDAPFERLLETIRFDPARDRLWLVGDLVNRGPDSLACLRRVKAMGKSTVTVLGNHDLHLLAMAWGVDRGKGGDTLDAIFAAPDRDELLDWLLHRPLFHRDEATGWSLVHGGLPPDWDLEQAAACAREVESALREDPASFFARMYGDLPDRWDPELTGAERLRFMVNAFTRLRFVTEDGRLDLAAKGTPEDAPAGTLPWFRHPRRMTRGERIVFGHWSTLGYLYEDGALSLDTGCVWGGSLTAARLERSGPGTAAPETVTVDCPGYRTPG